MTRTDKEKLEEIKKIFEAYPYESISALVTDEDGKWVKNRRIFESMIQNERRTTKEKKE